jgi:U3 small nucleolar RNA-associated protein 13
MARRQSKNDDELSSSSSAGSGSEEEQSDDSTSEQSSSGEVPMKEDMDDASEQEDNESSSSDDEIDSNQMKNNAGDSNSPDDDSGSSSDGGDDDSEDEVMKNASSSFQQPAISKSWTVLTTHSPCYTGGTVALSHQSNLAQLAADDDKESSQPFILAQRGGDVSIIEASTGLLLRTVRKGTSFEGGNLDENEDEDDDEEEMMDAEAITAFALSPNNRDLIAVTRSHLVRKYNLAVPADDGYEEVEKQGKNDKKESIDANGKPEQQSIISIKQPAKVTFSFGKSGHKLPVTKVAFHPSGIFFATGSVDGLVKVWDIRNGYATHALHPTSAASGGGRGTYAVSCIQWRPTSASLILAIGREDGSISIHDLLLNAQDTKSASMPVAVLRDHISAVTCVAWSSEGSGGGSTSSSGSRKHGSGVFFSSGRDSVINTWLISEQEVTDTSSSPKSKKRRKSREDEGTNRATSVKVTYQRIRTLPVYEQVESMLLLPRRFRQSLESRGRSEVLSRKQIVLATCGTKGVVRLWTAISGDKDAGVQNAVSDLSLFASQSESDAFGEDMGGYTSLHLTSDDNNILAIDAEQNMAFLQLDWTNADKTELGLVSNRAIVGHNGEILDLSVIPGLHKNPVSGVKEQAVAVATNSSQVRIFGVAENNDSSSDDHPHTALSPRGILDGHTAIVLSLDCSPCGRYLATAGKDKSMRIWNVPTRTCVAIATGHTEAVGSVAMSNKIGCYDVGGKAAESGAGAFAVTCSKDRTLKVWSLPGSAVLDKTDDEITLNARLSIRAHEKDINIVSVAPNDSLIATGSQDKTIKLWRTSDLALHGTLKGHKRGVWDCQFSQHDRVLATGSGDRTVKLWSIADCSCVRTFQGHMASVLRVRFIGTGLQLLSSGSDGLIKLWTIRTNECESTIDGHDDKIWALDLSQTTGTLFSGGADSKIAVWRDTTKEKDDEKREAEEKNILMEQTLSNHLRHKRYEQALELALELDKPQQVLKVLTDILEKDAASSRGIETLQKHAANWQLDKLVQILRYCREWNTRARNSHIAMLVVKAIVTTIPAAKLATYQGVPEILAGIAPYAERHFERLDGMVGNSYLLDYTLFSMGSIHGESKVEGYDEWLANRKYLPPKVQEGRIQIGGSLIVEGKKGHNDENGGSSDEDVMTIGDSDTEDEDE